MTMDVCQFENLFDDILVQDWDGMVMVLVIAL